MLTSKVSCSEGARYGGLDGTAGSIPAQLRPLALGHLFSHMTAGLVFEVGATFSPKAAFTSAVVEAPKPAGIILAISATSARHRLTCSRLCADFGVA